jgi:hypothetical protein
MYKRPLKPPYIVGSVGNPSGPLSRSVKGAIHYLYPQEFPEHSRTPVKAEQICAARDFNARSGAALSERELRAMLITCAMRPALVFAREAIRLLWGADRIDSHMRDFVRSALAWVGLASDTEFEASAEWRQYEDALVEASKLQAAQSQIPVRKVRAGPDPPVSSAPNGKSIANQLEVPSRHNPKDWGADPTSFATADTTKQERRRAVVAPILKAKGWTVNKWGTQAGVGRNCPYEYLGGRRNLSNANRVALAQVLGLKAEDIPD